MKMLLYVHDFELFIIIIIIIIIAAAATTITTTTTSHRLHHASNCWQIAGVDWKLLIS